MKGQGQEPCPEDRFTSAAPRSRSRAVEFLASDTQVAQDRSDGSCFQFMSAPVWNDRSAARRWTNPDLVIATGASIQDASESMQLACEFVVSQTATMTSLKP